MHIFFVILLFILGLLLIIKGGDFFVDAASWIAKISGIPKLIIGATIVSVATTLPELLVSIFAALDGKVDIAIGNAVGSVTANTGLIMAISLIFLTSNLKRKDCLLKTLILLASSAIIAICGIFGEVNLYVSIALLVIFCLFIWENIRSAKKESFLSQTQMADLTNKDNEKNTQTTNTETKDETSTENKDTTTKPKRKRKRIKPTKKEIWINMAKFVLGIAGIVIGADLLVDYGSELALRIGISERIIGVTLIAIGTSLPELVTTITAIIKKQSDLSVGNIIGANIIDLTLILPLCSIISGQAIPISSTSAVLDLPVCFAICALAILPMFICKKFKRWQGFALVTAYVAYLSVTCFVFI